MMLDKLAFKKQTKNEGPPFSLYLLGYTQGPASSRVIINEKSTKYGKSQRFR